MADGRGGSRNSQPDPAEVARRAIRVLAELTGRPPETVLGLHRDDEGWKVTIELVELSRVPYSTDLLGVYVVSLDRDGDLIGYQRTRRYQRSQAREEQ